MSFNTNLLKNRAIININDEAFGVTFTHWTRKRRTWSFRWQDVIAIEAVMVAIPLNGDQFRFLIQGVGDKRNFISDDMENWSALEDMIRKRFPDFNWANVDAAKVYANMDKRFSCWKRENATQGK